MKEFTNVRNAFFFLDRFIGENKKTIAAREKFASFISSIIAAKRQSLVDKPENERDLLDLMLHSQDEESGRKLTDTELQHNMNTFFIAGHETTSSTMTSALYFLANNADVQAKAREEVDRVLGGREPVYEDMKELKYLNLVIKETLRMFSPVVGLSRKVIEDHTLCGYRLFKDDTIVLLTHSVQRWPDYWKEPDRFWPERWESDDGKGANQYCWLPFSAGPRMCIGINFAMIEMRVILSQLLQNYTFASDPAHPWVDDGRAITTRPTSDFSLIVQRRH